MRDKKYRLEIFAMYDRLGMETHLEEMAQEGWLLEEISGFLWCYRRIEPQKLTFCVAYYFTEQNFDMELTEEQEAFYEFCAHTGWQLAAHTQQMHIFYNEKTDPIPIETDPVLEVKKIGRQTLKFNSPLYPFLWYNLAWRNLNTDPIRLFSDAENWIWPIFLLLIATLQGLEQISFFLWHRKAKQLAEQGIFLKKKNASLFWRAFVGVFALPPVLYACVWLAKKQVGTGAMVCAMTLNFILLWAVVWGIKKLLKRCRITGYGNLMITVLLCGAIGYVMTNITLKTVLQATYKDALYGGKEAEATYEYRGRSYPLYLDPLPLRVEDLMEVPADSYTYQLEEEGTFLLRKWEARQKERADARGYLPYLSYTVLETKIDYIYDRCKEELTSGGYIPVDPSPWGAKEAYQRNFQYVLCYEERLVQFYFSGDQSYTEEQMMQVKVKLGESEKKSR